MLELNHFFHKMLECNHLFFYNPYPPPGFKMEAPLDIVIQTLITFNGSNIAPHISYSLTNIFKHTCVHIDQIVHTFGYYTIHVTVEYAKGYQVKVPLWEKRF